MHLDDITIQDSTEEVMHDLVIIQSAKDPRLSPNNTKLDMTQSQEEHS